MNINSFKNKSLLILLCLFIPIQAYSECSEITGESGSGSQPDRFVPNEDGTVTDTPSGLMWKSCLQGLSGSACTGGAASELSWVSALNEARGTEFAGFDNWRLPKLDEIVAIVDSCYDNPAINPAIFPNHINGSVWTASANLDYATDAWSINFSDGQPVVKGRHETAMVHLVRDNR